jgi:NAD(P)-dependent dehydrogenase (short-subunit alcohol dehydrogenase family)
MRDFRDRVAVVTGAGSGIGRGLAEKFAAEGMHVVLADVQEDALAEVEGELRGRDARVIAVRTDVSSAEQVERLADAAYAEFGAVHILCNNAGVAGGGGGPVWTATEKDWRWVLGVNLFGVIHGVRVFVPRMLAQESEGHIVNTASVLGLSTGPGGGPYGVSKHGVVRLTEGLYFDLLAAGSRLRASVLCPGMIATNIITSGRNRPAEMQNELDEAARQQMAAQQQQMADLFQTQGMPPAEVADMVCDAIREERLYILTHDTIKDALRRRVEPILEGRNPDLPPARGLAAMAQQSQSDG